MKKQMVCSLMVLPLLIAGAGSLTARASSGALSAEVAFDFMVKGKVFPAGEYILEWVNRDSSTVLLLRQRDGKAQMLVTSQTFESNQPSPDSRLVFHRYGDESYLSAVYFLGSEIGIRLPTGPEEEMLAKLTTQVNRSIVTVPANAR